MAGNEGFTLIEIMASLVILSIIGLTIFSLIPGTFRALNFIAERTEAIYEARGSLNRDIRDYEGAGDQEMVIEFNPVGEEEKELFIRGDLLKNEIVSDDHEVAFVYYYPVLSD